LHAAVITSFYSSIVNLARVVIFIDLKLGSTAFFDFVNSSTVWNISDVIKALSRNERFI